MIVWSVGRSKSTIIPLLQWEVCPDQVDFKEEIGSGAFGKVLRGIYRESPGIEVFCKSRTPIVDFKEGKTVAVKVLGGMYSFKHPLDHHSQCPLLAVLKPKESLITN